MTDERETTPSGWEIEDGDETPFVSGITERALDKRLTKSFVNGRDVAVADFAEKVEKQIRERLAAGIQGGSGRLRVEANFEAILSEVLKTMTDAQPRRR